MYRVFVYCGGKCGSSTLQKTFVQNKYSSIQIHGNDFYQKVYNTPSTIFDVINNSSVDIPVYIIDSYRLPIERKISSFFQNISRHYPNYKSSSVNELIMFFNNNLLYDVEKYHPINEVLSYYKVPLFNSFNFEKGYNEQIVDNKIFIKIRFCDIQNWGSILSTILDTPITLYSDNETQYKDQYELYVQFKSQYKVPKQYLENLHNDIEFNIYNTKKEQEEYMNKWTNLSY
jgi:hypothetical protein